MIRFARSLPDQSVRCVRSVQVFSLGTPVLRSHFEFGKIRQTGSALSFSTEAWRPGKKRPVNNIEEEDEDEKEKRLEYEKQRAAFLAQQKRMNDEADAAAEAADKKKKEEEEKAAAAKQQQRKDQQEQQQQRQSNQKSAGPSIFSQLPFSKKSSNNTSSAADDAAHITPSIEVPIAPPTASAAAGGKLPDLKIQLRRFFRQIHPDLFESHPREKEQNAKSLALLTDFLDTLRGGNSSGLPRGSRDRQQSKTAQVVFWVRAKEKETKPGDNAPPPTGATFYKISSTLALNTAAHHGTNQLYSSLSSLFKQAGLLHANNWAWGDEYDAASKASKQKSDAETGSSDSSKTPSDPFSSPYGNYNDEYFAQFASAAEGIPFGNTGELERYVRTIRAQAAHYEHLSRMGKHEFLFKMTNLRLQGIKLIFEDETWEMQTQKAILDVYEKVLQQSKYFKPPNRVRSTGPHSEDPSGPSSSRFQSAGNSYANDPGTPNKPAQPNIPFSQTVSVPEGFASMFAQIKKHQVREETQTKPGGAATVAATASQSSDTATSSSAAPDASAAASSFPSQSHPADLPKSDFESTRSPFSRVSTLFSLRHHSNHIDGRGRLIFSLHESETAWVNFINSDPTLIDRALTLQKNYKALKVLEKQVADSLGLFDVFCDSSLIAQPRPSGSSAGAADASTTAASLGIEAAYMNFLTRAQKEAHVFYNLRHVFPSTSEISLRVFQPSSEYGVSSSSDTPSADKSLVASAYELIDVDPVMGMLLVPTHASLADVRRGILERGQECVQIKKMHVEDLSDYTNALLHAKRHLKLRSLVPASNITRDQMREATERLSRTFGALRDLLQATSIVVGDQYELEEDGTICIPWNWS